jgi:hypothetical protein
MILWSRVHLWGVRYVKDLGQDDKLGWNKLTRAHQPEHTLCAIWYCEAGFTCEGSSMWRIWGRMASWGGINWPRPIYFGSKHTKHGRLSSQPEHFLCAIWYCEAGTCEGSSIWRIWGRMASWGGINWPRPINRSTFSVLYDIVKQGSPVRGPVCEESGAGWQAGAE